MAYPLGPLLQTLARRILVNLDEIEKLAPQPGDPDQDRPPYADTQLLILMLGVLVFPHERTPEALAELLAGYKSVSQTVTIRYDLANPDAETIRPEDVKNLPRLLRNGIAHFNVLPLGDRGGRFTGVRVWNEDDDGYVTLVADLDFKELRRVARYVLKALAKPTRDLCLGDPEDPLANGPPARPPIRNPPQPPRLSDTVWKSLLSACGGDAQWARTEMDRTLRARAREIGNGGAG